MSVQEAAGGAFVWVWGDWLMLDGVSGLLIGGPVVAGLVAFWGQIRGFLAKVRSLFVVNVMIRNGSLGLAISYFCWKKMRRVRIGDRYFRAGRYFVRPRNRNQSVVYEDIAHSGLLFFYGWIPIFFSRAERDSSGDYDGTFRLSFIRGTLDIDKFVFEAIEIYNRVKYVGFREKRFFIRRAFGTFGEVSNGGQENSKECVDEEVESDLDLWDKRLIHWVPDQLGEEGATDGNPFESLVFPASVMDAVKMLEHWKNSEGWYKERGIPWKRGALFYGPPGTGKTSLVRAIGRHLDLPIVSFALGSFTDREFQEGWMGLKRMVPCIALIEDIDGVFHGRTHVGAESTMGKPLSFDVFLNTIDGIEVSDGILTIVTTNHVEFLDAALGAPIRGQDGCTRPGRIDFSVRLTILGERERRLLAERILADCPEHIERLVAEGEGESAAQFQNRCGSVALREYWKLSEEFKAVAVGAS